MSLLLNLLRQLLEYYGVPPELLLQWCEICLSGIACRIGPHLPSNTFSGIHFQQLCAVSRNCLMSWTWENKKYGCSRSFVRRLGKILSLSPCQRPRFQLVQSLNSLECKQSSTANIVTPSLTDVLWMTDNDRGPSTRFRFDEWQEVVPVQATSKGRTQKVTVANEEAFKKIYALEDELAHLRAQIAAIVAVNGARKEESSSSNTVESSNSPCNTLRNLPMTSTPVPIAPCNVVIPPPPPPPPLPAVLSSDLDSHNSTIELIKQRRASNEIINITGSAAQHKVKTVPSMMDVLKDINKVKLRVVERSPGGTPLPRSKKKRRSQWDPAALIAEALKEKFASQSNVNDSSDKENRSCDASPFSSPDTPMVGRHVLKPSVRQTFNRTEELTQVSATKARVHC